MGEKEIVEKIIFEISRGVRVSKEIN